MAPNRPKVVILALDRESSTAILSHKHIDLVFAQFG
jgi:hypothetical protein